MSSIENTQCRVKNNPRSDEKKYYYGTVGVAVQSRREKWIPIHLKLWSIKIEIIRNLEVFIQETDIFSVDWADVRIVSKSNNNGEVCSRSNGRTLARGAFNSCLLFVAGCRKKLVKEHRDNVENSIEALLFEAEQLVKSQESSDLERAFTLTVKVREMSTWIGGECFKATVEEVQELRELIQNRKNQDSVESSCATEQVEAVLVEAAA